MCQFGLNGLPWASVLSIFSCRPGVPGHNTSGGRICGVEASTFGVSGFAAFVFGLRLLVFGQGFLVFGSEVCGFWFAGFLFLVR